MKMVPKILSEYQKQQRFTVCQDITKHLEAEPDLLNSVITGDETWVFKYNPETKRQSGEWKRYGSPRPVKARKSKSKVKVMLIVHFEFLPQSQTVNQTIYKEILQHLVRSVCEKRWSLWESHAWHSIMIMLLLTQPGVFISLSQKEKLQLCNTPHIPPIWAHVTFFSSLRSNLF